MEQFILKTITGLAISYLLGSIPTGYLFGRLIKGVDIRKYGSGNLGATNAFRVLGKTAGICVLIIDILKGTTAILLANAFFFAEEIGISGNLYICFNAIAVVSGHNWTIFLGFKGGKGIATTLGVLIGFSVLIDRFVWLLFCLLILWLAVFLPTGLVSLASVISSVILPLAAIFFHLPKEISAFLLILAVFSLIKHKSNIYRLLHKKEKRFNTMNFLKKLFGKTLSN